MEKLLLILMVFGLLSCGDGVATGKPVDPVGKPDSDRILINDTLPHHVPDSLTQDSLEKLKPNQ